MLWSFVFFRWFVGVCMGWDDLGVVMFYFDLFDVGWCGGLLLCYFVF